MLLQPSAMNRLELYTQTVCCQGMTGDSDWETKKHQKLSDWNQHLFQSPQTPVQEKFKSASVSQTFQCQVLLVKGGSSSMNLNIHRIIANLSKVCLRLKHSCVCVISGFDCSSIIGTTIRSLYYLNSHIRSHVLVLCVCEPVFISSQGNSVQVSWFLEKFGGLSFFFSTV